MPPPRPPLTTLVIHTWKEHGKPRPWRDDSQSPPSGANSVDDHGNACHLHPSRSHQRTPPVLSPSSTCEDLRYFTAHHLSASPLTLSASSTFEDLHSLTHPPPHVSSLTISSSWTLTCRSGVISSADRVPRSSSFDAALLLEDDVVEMPGCLLRSTAIHSTCSSVADNPRPATHKRGTSLSASMDTLPPRATASSSGREVSLREATLLKQSAQSVSECFALRDMTQRQSRSVDAGLSSIATRTAPVQEQTANRSVVARTAISHRMTQLEPAVPSQPPSATAVPKSRRSIAGERTSALALSEIDASKFAESVAS